MAKYSYEFQKKVVQEYLDGKGGYGYLSRKYNIAKDVQVMNWVKAYQAFGNEGLMRSRQNNNYSFQFKLYLSSEVSYQELALSQGINSPRICPHPFCNAQLLNFYLSIKLISRKLLIFL